MSDDERRGVDPFATQAGDSQTEASEGSGPDETEIDPYLTVVRAANPRDDPYATVAPPGSAPVEPTPKVRYFGNFELLEEIARGGMGVVYKARQAGLNRIVALKMILSGQLAGQADVDRFRLEAEAAAGLDHPGIVPIFEIGEHEGHHFFAMGYVDGPSLANRVSTGPLPPRDAVRYAVQIAEAVQYAHDQGVIHRDLKPANILIDRDDRPKVTDFGLAKKFEGDSGLTATGQVMGTPSYMPPEQAEGKTRGMGPSVDVYSLGATLYCLLTGRPPFLAAGAMETLLQVLEQEPLPPRRLNPEINPDLETICLKCLEKEPVRRYASAREVGEELTRFLKGEPILARPIGPLARTWRWCRRNPAVASAVALASSLLLLVAVAGPIVALRQSALRKAETAARQVAEASRTAETVARQSAERATTDLAAEKDRAVARNYATSVDLAHYETLNNNISTARQILSDSLATARGWEWNYVDALANPERLVLRGHVGQVGAVRFAPDSRRLTSDGNAGNLVYWDAVDGQQLRQYEPGAYRTLSSSGRLFADKVGEEIVIRDIATGAIPHRFAAGNSEMIARAFSLDDRFFAAAVKDAVVLVDLSRNYATTVLRGPIEGRKVTLALSPDGSRVAAGLQNASILLWDVAKGGSPATLKGHLLPAEGVTFSPDGKMLASAGFDGTIRLWDVELARELRALRGHVGWVYKVDFSPDGRFVASAGWDTSVRVWDVATGREVSQFRGNFAYVFNVAFSPDGKQIASACADGTVRVWDARQALASAASIPDEMVRTFEETAGPAAREEMHQYLMGHRTADEVLAIGHTEPVESVKFAPDAKYAATSGRDGTVRLWDPATGRQIRVIRVGKENFGSQLAITADGRSLVVSTGKGIDGDDPRKIVLSAGEVKVYDPASGEERMTLEAPNGPVLALAAHPVRNWLAVAAGYPAATLAMIGARGVQPIPTEIRIWDLDRRSLARTIPLGDSMVRSLAFHPDGSTIVLAGLDAIVKVRGLADGRERLSIEAGAMNAIYSPDGRQIATASGDGSIKLWDSTTGRLIRTMEGHSKFVLGLAFTPDGSRLASSSHDTTIKIWDPASGLDLLTLRGHSHEVYSVAFDPLGRRLASVSYDGTAKFWDSRTTPEDRSIDSWALVFADDFRRANLGDGWRSMHGEWSVKEGRLEGRVQPRTVAGIAAPVVSSRVTLKGVVLPPTCEVRFDLQTHSPIVCQVLFLDDAQVLGETVDLAGVVNPFFRTNVSLLMAQLAEMLFSAYSMNRSFQLEPGKTYDVRILRQPGGITVKVDGQVVLNGRQHGIEVANLSLSGIHGQPGETIDFSNLRIHAPQSALDEQLARKEVGRLFDDVGLRSEVVDRLKSDQKLSRTVVERGTRFAEAFDEDANKLVQASMTLSISPDRAPSAYALAFRQAEAAYRMVPDRSVMSFGLGAASYRVGDNQKAVELLSRAREMNLSTQGYSPPAGPTFLAMAHFRLGDRDDAKREFERLRDLLRSRPWKVTEDAKLLFREAEACLGPLSTPDPEAEAIKDVVIRAEQGGWEDGNLAAYLSSRLPEERGTSSRTASPGPSDLTVSGPALANTRRWQFLETPKGAQTYYDNARSVVTGDRATLDYEVTVVLNDWLRSWEAHYDLFKTPDGWKVVTDRSWPIRAREGGKIVSIDKAYWLEKDRLVEQARASNDLRAIVNTLGDALRFVEALAAARKLTEIPGASANDWVMRGNVALAAFESEDALQSMKKALAIDPKVSVPSWAK